MQDALTPGRTPHRSASANTGRVTPRSPPTGPGAAGTSRRPSGTRAGSPARHASASPARAAGPGADRGTRAGVPLARGARRRQVGDAEAGADQIAGGPKLGLETVERREHLLATPRRAAGGDLHLGPHPPPEGREEGAGEAFREPHRPP